MTTLNPKTHAAIMDFAELLIKKAEKAEQKYGYTTEWTEPERIPALAKEFQQHVEKGDPLDVALYCMFLLYHNVSTKGNSHVR